MKKLFLLLALFGVLGVSCSKDDDNVNNSQKPNDKPKGTFVSDVEGVYNVDMSGGEVVVTVTTDIEYKVVIPTDAKSWISVAETRADLRIDKIKFIIAPNETFEELRADVNLVANNGYVLQKISFVQQGNTKVFNSDCEESYSIGAVGGKINIKVTTNMDYDVVIPNNDKSWISVSDTRAVVREETLTLIVAENKITEERSSVVTLYDKDDNILQKINITQSAKSNTIANNEIWYTTTDGKKLFPPTTEPAIFGAFLVSNTYSDGKGVLTFDDDITLIGDSAFSDCTTLATITIPESVTEIGNSAFNGCSSLTSITIPDSVTSIGDDAFRDCSSLTSITIPDGVTAIPDDAFINCSSLTSVTIPDSVTSIGKYAFSGCTGELVVNCDIPSASSYSSGAFYGSKFTSVTIGDSATEIGDYAFYDCSSLTSVIIGDSVTIIGVRAFRECSSLTSVTIGDSVTTIGESAFYNCSSLTSVTIGDSITSIGGSAFCYCSSLTKFNGKFASEDGRCLIIDGTLNSFAIGCGATEYTIPDGVTTIGNSAFAWCDSLTSVTIPDSVTTIGNGVFYNCSSLTSVTIGDSVTTIGQNAFAYCGSLTSVYCKATTPPAAGGDMFYNIPPGLKIYVPMESVEAYKSSIYWLWYAGVIEGYNF